jgi:hypothetical protein
MVKRWCVLSVALATSLIATTATASSFSGVWLGEYVCRQGKTALSLSIGADASGKMGAVFQFSAHPSNAGVPMGSFFADATIDAEAGKITLKPNRWFVQPNSRYRMVGLEGKLSGRDMISGKLIAAPGCSSFKVHRNARAAKLRGSKGIDGVWSGSYRCAQGKTALALTISGGTKGAIKISPADWKLRPSGFRKVGLEGSIKGRSMSGKVTGVPGCSSFKLRR